jgi:hypothetical protein
VLGSTSMWSIWLSYQGPLLLSKISKSKMSEKGRCTFRGARDSVLFHRMRKESILLLHKQEKNLANIVINFQLYLSTVD